MQVRIAHFKSDEYIKLYRRAINIIQNYLPQEQRQQLKRISKRKLICFGMKLLLKAPVNIAEWVDVKRKTRYPDMINSVTF